MSLKYFKGGALDLTNFTGNAFPSDQVQSQKKLNQAHLHEFTITETFKVFFFSFLPGLEESYTCGSPARTLNLNINKTMRRIIITVNTVRKLPKIHSLWTLGVEVDLTHSLHTHTKCVHVCVCVCVFVLTCSLKFMSLL